MYQTDILSSIEKSIIAIAISAVFAAFYFLALMIVEQMSGKKITDVPQLCLIAFVFGLLALVTGIITGASRSAAVGEVLPAALGLIGAVALYVISNSKSQIPTAATAVAAFSAMLILGTVLGSFERVRSAAYQASLEFDFERLKTQADIEFVINGYRRSRGLPPVVLSD